jgi:hypothetical protein
MHRSKLLTTVILAIQFSAVQVVAQTCASYCTNYDQTLVNCRNLYSAGVVGTGPISTDAVSCMCVGTEAVTGYYVMSECYQCHLLTGGDSDVLFAWVIACFTNYQLGPQVAAQCWNQNLLNGNTGEPCAQGSAHPSASRAAVTPSSVEIVVSSATFSFRSVATASASTGVG